MAMTSVGERRNAQQRASVSSELVAMDERENSMYTEQVQTKGEGDNATVNSEPDTADAEGADESVESDYEKGAAGVEVTVGVRALRVCSLFRAKESESVSSFYKTDIARTLKSCSTQCCPFSAHSISTATSDSSYYS